MLANQVPEVATRLGWKVTEDDVSEAVNILIGINRVTQPSASTPAD